MIKNLSTKRSYSIHATLIMITCITLCGCHSIPKQIISANNYSQSLLENPEQTPTLSSEQPIKKYRIRPVNTFRLIARVLAKKRHYFDEWHTLLPIDLSLGWGKMADLDLIKSDDVQFWHEGRFNTWDAASLNHFTEDEIIRKSTNIHILPANKSIKEYLFSAVQKGDLIYLEGDLVDVQDEKGVWTPTSTRRDDTGAGACEILLVRKVHHIDG